MVQGQRDKVGFCKKEVLHFQKLKDKKICVHFFSIWENSAHHHGLIVSGTGSIKQGSTSGKVKPVQTCLKAAFCLKTS